MPVKARVPLLATLLMVFAGGLVATSAGAHCDTLDGPVVAAAREALAAGDPTPVLRWVDAAHEAEVREAFSRTLAVRRLDDQALQLADRYFFETLVRLHRAGEGFAFTGLKPAGSPVPSAVAAADAALRSGSPEALVSSLQSAVEHGLRERFDRVQETARHADESVAAGRRYVAAYVDYAHYAEGIEAASEGHPGETHGAGSPASHDPHD